MHIGRHDRIMLGAIALMFAVGASWYTSLPGLLVNHGGGLPTMPGFWTLWGLPLFAVGLWLFSHWLPLMERKRFNPKFNVHFRRIGVVFFSFLLIVYIVALLRGLGVSIFGNTSGIIFTSVVFYAAGELTAAGDVWFISEPGPIWLERHPEANAKLCRFARPVFWICAIVMLLGMILPVQFHVLILICVIGIFTVLTAYSFYLRFRA